MPTPTYSSFYAFLMAKLEQYGNEVGIPSSISEKIEENADIFTILDHDTHRWILSKLVVEGDSLSIIDNGNWQNNKDDKLFLESVKHDNYRSFFQSLYFENNPLTETSLSEVEETEILKKLSVIDEKIFPSIKKNPQLNVAENDIVIEESLDVEPAPDSFCRYLAETIQKQKRNNQPVSIQQIQDYILNLANDEENRVQFIKLLCDNYEKHKRTQPINRDNPSDALLLKSMEFKNFLFLLKARLPLTLTDWKHIGIYSAIGDAGPTLDIIQNNQLTAVVSTQSTIASAQLIAEKKDRPTSFAQVLKELVSKYRTPAIRDSSELIDALSSLTPSQKIIFLSDLRTLWRNEIREVAGRFNQEGDTAFLKKTGKANYTFFLNDLFPSANPLDQFVFSEIGQHTPTLTRPTVKQNNAQPPSKETWQAAPINDAAAAANENLKDQGKAFFNATAKKIGNRLNDKRSNQERFERFNADKANIRKTAKNFVFARIIGADVNEHISLKATAGNCLWSGIKKAAGYLITPLKGIFFVRKTVDDIFNYFEKKDYAAQYDSFYNEIGDQGCNQAINNALNRVETTIKNLLERLGESDYEKVVLYLTNKIELAFDAINYSLMPQKPPKPPTEFSLEWNKLTTPEQKQAQVEEMLFYMIFQPVRGVHHNEKITIDNDSYRLEALMTLMPLKMPDGQVVFRKYREDEKEYQPRRLKNEKFYFDGNAYEDGMKGPRDRELEAIKNWANEQMSSGPK